MRLCGSINRLIPDAAYIRMMYYYHFGKMPNLHNPKTFNEKLQWLKLYDHNPLYTTMVDKVKVKDYVISKVGDRYIIPTIATWNNANQIDFTVLPDKFVLKCNHDSHGVVVVKDKKAINESEVRSYLSSRMANNGYWYGREWPYKNVEKQILAEQYISDGNEELTDYKIHCFNGEPKIVLVCQNRFDEGGLKEDFYDTKWRHLDVGRPGIAHGKLIDRPLQLDEMINVARTLSADIPFLRTDFYCVDGTVLFGELTFFPASGFKRFVPDRFDRMLGDWLKLPQE